MAKYRLLMWRDLDFDPMEAWNPKDSYYFLELLRGTPLVDVQEIPLPNDTKR